MLFDAAILVPGAEDAARLAAAAVNVNWLRDAFGHLKAIGYNEASRVLFAKGGLDAKAPGVVALDGKGGIDAFISAAKKHKIWERDSLVNPPR